MSETVAHPPLATLWNMSAPLRVLLLEDSADDAELDLLELKRAGFQCRPRVVSTRAEFAAQLARFAYDVVLADYSLGGWTAMEAFADTREAGRDVPFILVTGALGEEVAVECIRQGVTDYVPKEHLSRLPLVVARALEEKSSRSARAFMVEALRQSEANSLFLFANNPLPMWVFDRDTLQILHVNDAALHRYGYDRVKFLRMSAADLHPAEEVAKLLSTFRSDAPQTPGQWHHYLKNGSAIDVEIFLHQMDYSGSAATLVIALDITERKRAEEERQKFFTLVENSRDFIAVADLRGNMEYVNPAGRELLGIASAAAVKGTRTVNYVAADDLPLFRNIISAALRSDGHWEGELRFRHQQTGQPLPVDFVGFQVKDPQSGEPRFVATVSRDMSERQALEQQLRHAQKFEAIGQLAGGIAHDFNNVIGAILGWAELGEEQLSSVDAPGSGYFKKIHSQCDRAAALIRQLLAFARRQILEPRTFSLNQAVRDVLNLLENVIGKDIELKTELPENLSVIRADPTQIEQVLMNLCINSRDAMPKGGRLTIRTKNAEFSSEECRRNAALLPGRFAGLAVSDTGIGMDAAVRERIFEPFFTTKGAGKGTGLGLATVYGIVKQHGGFIQVESEPGHGSTFHVFLPVDEDPATSEGARIIVEESPVRGGTETILIAEDHEGIREMARAALESLGYRVLTAHDGQEAITTFSAHRDSIALVVLDVIMPCRSGPEAYGAIAALNSRVPVIFATGYTNETAALAEIVRRGVVLLRKPYSLGALCRKIRDALDRAAGNPPPSV